MSIPRTRAPVSGEAQRDDETEYSRARNEAMPGYDVNRGGVQVSL